MKASLEQSTPAAIQTGDTVRHYQGDTFIVAMVDATGECPTLVSCHATAKHYPLSECVLLVRATAAERSAVIEALALNLPMSDARCKYALMAALCEMPPETFKSALASVLSKRSA